LRWFPIALSAIAGPLLIAAWLLWPPLDLHQRPLAAAVTTLHSIHELQAQIAASNPTRGFACFLDFLEVRSGGDMTVQAFHPRTCATDTSSR